MPQFSHFLDAAGEKTRRIPKYREHRASGQAVVTINGRDHYLGRFRSAGSRREYDRLVGEWIAAGRPIAPADDPDALTVAELINRFWTYAKVYYRAPDGTEASELHNLRLAFRPLRRLYGHTPAAIFGPLALQAVRQAMIDARLVRTSINRHVGRIKLAFKWAVAQEIIPAAVFHGLQSVGGLRQGRSGAKESDPVQPVPEVFIDAVHPHVAPEVWAMIQLQLLTAARPGEILAMRACDLDTSASLWVYSPRQHKTAYRGHQRRIYLGPRAQAIVREYLTTDLEAFLFSPRRMMARQRAKRRASRKTPMSPSQAKRNPKMKPQRAPGERYTLHSYRRAIDRAVAKVNALAAEGAEAAGVEPPAPIPSWHPHRLRHNAATRLRKEYGIDTARAVLGHRSPAITEVYAELDHGKAVEALSLIG